MDAVAAQGVIAGAYDMSRTSPLSVFIAFLRGIPVAVVAPENLFRSSNPNALLQIAADAPYKIGATYPLTGPFAAATAGYLGACSPADSRADLCR